MNSFTERKEFPVTLFQSTGAWICGNIYILVSGRMVLLCAGGGTEESPRLSKTVICQKGKGVCCILRVLFQCLRGIIGTFSRGFQMVLD